VHRFVPHGFAPIAHRLHHANPDDPVFTIFRQIWICFALVYLIAGGAFVAGVLVAYAWYLFVHHCAHQGPDKLSLQLLKHHQSHHRFATRNYGVSPTTLARFLEWIDCRLLQQCFDRRHPIEMKGSQHTMRPKKAAHKLPITIWTTSLLDDRMVHPRSWLMRPRLCVSVIRWSSVR
jgi:hypothetical protein